MRVAAKHADYTNYASSVDEFIHKSEVLAGHTAAIGRDYDEIVRSSNFTALVGETEADVEAKVDEYAGRIAGIAGEDEGEAARANLRRIGLVGTPEQVVDQLRPWVAAGMAYAVCYFPDAAYDTGSLELFARHVAPVLD